MWLSTAPMFRPDTSEAALTPSQTWLAAAPGWEDARDAVLGNCSMCHAREPFWDGVAVAPKGILLETERDIHAHAHEVYVQAGLTHAMPPPGASQMDVDARASIVAWYRAGREYRPVTLRPSPTTVDGFGLEPVRKMGKRRASRAALALRTSPFVDFRSGRPFTRRP